LDDIELYPFLRFDALYQKETTFYFPKGLLGLPNVKELYLTKEQKLEPYFFLDQLNGNARFIVCDPFTFFPDYSPLIARSDLREIAIQDESPLFLLTIVNAKSAPPRLNLRAPLLIDWQQKKGKQIIVGNEG